MTNILKEVYVTAVNMDSSRNNLTTATFSIVIPRDDERLITLHTLRNCKFFLGLPEAPEVTVDEIPQFIEGLLHATGLSREVLEGSSAVTIEGGVRDDYRDA